MVDTRAMFKPNFNLLLFWTCCHCHFEFEAIWRTRALCLNFVIILKLLLLLRGVNSPRLCYVNNEVESVTLCLNLTCYGKQRRHFEFEAIWRTSAVILNFVIILQPGYARRM